MIALFWDLDGTLLLTGRAGLFAFEHAVLEVTGRRMDLSKLSTPGIISSQLAKRISRKVVAAIGKMRRAQRDPTTPSAMLYSASTAISSRFVMPPGTSLRMPARARTARSRMMP